MNGRGMLPRVHAGRRVFPLVNSAFDGRLIRDRRYSALLRPQLYEPDRLIIREHYASTSRHEELPDTEQSSLDALRNASATSYYRGNGSLWVKVVSTGDVVAAALVPETASRSAGKQQPCCTRKSPRRCPGALCFVQQSAKSVRVFISTR